VGPVDTQLLPVAPQYSTWPRWAACRERILHPFFGARKSEKSEPYTSIHFGGWLLPLV
jgi:hypothetical protein